MMTPHTPGPWKAVEVFGTLPYVVSRDQVIAERVFNGSGNVHLIAAAPDLLEAIKALHDILIQFTAYQRGEWCQKAVAAIAKAEGGAK